MVEALRDGASEWWVGLFMVGAGVYLIKADMSKP